MQDFVTNMDGFQNKIIQQIDQINPDSFVSDLENIISEINNLLVNSSDESFNDLDTDFISDFIKRIK